MARSGVFLEEGKEEDADRIYHIHTSAIVEVCSSHYGPKEIEIWAGKQRRETYIPFLNNKEIIVAKENGTVVGFIHHLERNVDKRNGEFGISKGNLKVQIKGLFIDPSFVRRGLGKLLVKKVETLAAEKGADCLIVSASLNSASFYNLMGFKEVQRENHQISCQCSVQCVSMMKNLNNQNN